jgi:AcrR family transcriptional regulator
LAHTATRPYAGKSADARRAEQRERILIAARDVFAARGFGRAGVDEIVASARVSRTTFYAFFDNKEDCLLAVFQWGVERVNLSVARAVAAAAALNLAPAKRVRSEVRAVAAALAQDPAMARIILIEIVGATPAAEEARIRVRQQAAQIIEAQLEQYEYWRERQYSERRTASLAAMAAIGEPISELVATGRIDQWEGLVDPVSEFVARGLSAL